MPICLGHHGSILSTRMQSLRFMKIADSVHSMYLESQPFSACSNQVNMYKYDTQACSCTSTVFEVVHKLAPGGEVVGRNVVETLVDEGAGVVPVHCGNQLITSIAWKIGATMMVAPVSKK